MIPGNKRVEIVGLGVYALFILFSFFWNFTPGMEIAGNLWRYTLSMMGILPCAFILIGLFEVWVDRSTVEKHLGENSSPLGYLWAVLLAGTIVGNLIVALPVSASLYKKGAKLSIIFTYIASAAICRVPMTIFEASYLGIEFTIVRLSVSIALVIPSSMLLGRFLSSRGYRIRAAEKNNTEKHNAGSTE